MDATEVIIRPVVSEKSYVLSAADRYWADRPLYDKLPGLDYFRYPPTFVLVVTPLSWFGTRAGGEVAGLN